VDAERAEVASERRVFIVGVARTGSTLLRHVLNRSPQVLILPETHFMKRARSLGLASRLASDGAASVTAVLYADDALSRTGYWAWLRRTVPPAEFQRRLAATEPTLAAVFALIIDLYVEHSGKDALRAVGEKTPSHLAFVPQFVSWYPDAVVIHTFRDPRAIYASELRRRREGRWGPKKRLRWLPGVVVGAALPLMEAVRTTVVWRRADRLDAEWRASLGERYALVRFEDLVTRPADALADICRRIGVEFDASLLDIDVVGSSFETDRHARAGFDPSAIDRWRTHVGPLARAWFRIALGARLRARGYRI
jgi:hypothetical protein